MPCTFAVSKLMRMKEDMFRDVRIIRDIVGLKYMESVAKDFNSHVVEAI